MVSSTLTEVECARALSRAAGTGRILRTAEMAALRLLETAAASWVKLEMAGRVLARARAPFPVEPIRTLDALHLATGVIFLEALPRMTVVSLNERVRANAASLGMEVRP